jgi:hypothetical protein
MRRTDSGEYVPAPVVHVVDVITVRDGHMAAPLAVNMVLTVMHGVFVGRLTFVVVIVLRPVKMTLVHIVDVISMRDRDMPAPVAMNMVMVEVFVVLGSHFCSQSLRQVAD